MRKSADYNHVEFRELESANVRLLCPELVVALPG